MVHIHTSFKIQGLVFPINRWFMIYNKYSSNNWCVGSSIAKLQNVYQPFTGDKALDVINIRKESLLVCQEIRISLVEIRAYILMPVKVSMAPPL